MADFNVLIVSPKKEGNTYEVASYLTTNSAAKLYVVDVGCEPDIENYEHIVLCSGVYGDKIHDSLSQWLDSIDMKKLKESVKFHLFLTWFGRGRSDVHAMEQAAKILKGKELVLNENYGSCFGGKFVIRKGHPNNENFSKALEWMKEQVKI